MVERPIDEEPPIAETSAAEEPRPKRRRSKKAAPESELAIPESVPAESSPVQAAEESAPPAKPARKRRSKVAEAPKPAETDGAAPRPQGASAEPVSVPAANNDTAEDDGSEPRRGWWQRTFG
jgi:ribonuclease E